VRLTGELQPAVSAVLGARLTANDPAPLAVALSGGGDSVALLWLAAEWARSTGRRLLALTVDHGLHPESRRWTAEAGEIAARAGAAWRALSWEGEKPSAGLPAAARAARHRLMAEAARHAGASVVLVGHTADDVLEAQLMRASGSTTPDPQEWRPSPVWPEGRGIFLLRPLLGIRRDALRAWLTERGEGWLDDPANADLRYARTRARIALAAEPPPAVAG
jgi:tRNA(Ile)-lysidine synthase